MKAKKLVILLMTVLLIGVVSFSFSASAALDLTLFNQAKSTCSFRHLFGLVSDTANNAAAYIQDGSGTSSDPYVVNVAYSESGAIGTQVRNFYTTNQVDATGLYDVNPRAGGTMTTYPKSNFTGTPLTQWQCAATRFVNVYPVITDGTNTVYYHLTFGASNAFQAVKGYYFKGDGSESTAGILGKNTTAETPIIGKVCIPQGTSLQITDADITVSTGKYGSQGTSSTGLIVPKDFATPPVVPSAHITSLDAGQTYQTIEIGSTINGYIDSSDGPCYYSVRVEGVDLTLQRTFGSAYRTIGGAGTISDPVVTHWSGINNTSINATERPLTHATQGILANDPNATVTYYYDAAYTSPKTLIEWQNNRYDIVYTKVVGADGVSVRYYKNYLGAGECLVGISTGTIEYTQSLQLSTENTPAAPKTGTVSLAPGQITLADLNYFTLGTYEITSLDAGQTYQTISDGNIIKVTGTWDNNGTINTTCYEITVEAAAATTRFTFTAETSVNAVAAGQNVVYALKAQDAASSLGGLGAWQAKVSYDSSVFDYVGCETFDNDATLDVEVNPQAGYVILGYAGAAYTAGEQTLLANITLTAKAGATVFGATVTISDVAASNASGTSQVAEAGTAPAIDIYSGSTTLGGQVRTTGTPGLRFGFTVSKTDALYLQQVGEGVDYDYAANNDSFKFGTLIAYAEDDNTAGFTPAQGLNGEELTFESDATTTMIDCVAQVFAQDDTKITYTAVLTGYGSSAVYHSSTATKFVARPYVQYTIGGVTITVYGTAVIKSVSDFIS